MRAPRLLSPLALLLAAAPVAVAEPIALVVTDDGFAPAEVSVGAGGATQLAVTNKTAAAIEFESYELNRERVIQPGQTVTIYLSGLEEGRYMFFDDFHQDRRGTLVVK